MVLVTLLDTVTGIAILVRDQELWWWTEGQGSFDDGRRGYFGHEPNGLYRRERYLICQATFLNGDSTESPSVERLNPGYSYDLLDRYIGSYEPYLPGIELEDEHKLIEVVILDTQTGETRSCSKWSYWWWAYGNGSCDCNRELLFDVEPYDENGVWKSTCLGAKRYLIVESSMLGSLCELNSDYPRELYEKHVPLRPS